jgi:molybdenum cofactor cytidylyltransferase
VAARLYAIVLAAGAGVRFGGGKLLSPWGEGVLLDGALAAAFAAPAEQVIVVTGADSERVSEAARRFAERAGEGARLAVAHAPRHAEGIAASVRAGISALPPDAEGAFIFLGDMPKVPTAWPGASPRRSATAPRRPLSMGVGGAIPCCSRAPCSRC